MMNESGYSWVVISSATYIYLSSHRDTPKIHICIYIFILIFNIYIYIVLNACLYIIYLYFCVSIFFTFSQFEEQAKDAKIAYIGRFTCFKTMESSISHSWILSDLVFIRPGAFGSFRFSSHPF